MQGLEFRNYLISQDKREVLKSGSGTSLCLQSYMVLAPCKLMQIREIVMWQFVISSGLSHFYGKIGDYVVIYRCKDKNTTARQTCRTGR